MKLLYQHGEVFELFNIGMGNDSFHNAALHKRFQL